jgi:ABC-type uncharacterized transport system permease subunit
MNATPKTLPVKPSRAPVASMVTLTALVACALLCTVIIGLSAAGSGGQISLGSLAIAIPELLRGLPWDQWLVLASWAALAGALFARGAGTRPTLVRTRLFAVISGILTPVGLVFFGHFVGRYWPDTTGPFDSPQLTFYLALYGLLTPWLLGRAALILSRSSPSDAAPA